MAGIEEGEGNVNDPSKELQTPRTYKLPKLPSNTLQIKRKILNSLTPSSQNSRFIMVLLDTRSNHTKSPTKQREKNQGGLAADPQNGLLKID